MRMVSPSKEEMEDFKKLHLASKDDIVHPTRESPLSQSQEAPPTFSQTDTGTWLLPSWSCAKVSYI